MDGTKSSSGWRLPAQELETLVVRTIAHALDEPGDVLGRLGVTKVGAARYRQAIDAAKALHVALVGGDADAIAQIVQVLVDRVTIDRSEIVVQLTIEALADRLGLTVPDRSSDERDGLAIALTTPIEMRRRGVEMRLVIPGERDRESTRIDVALTKAVARGHLWFEELATGTTNSIAEIAGREGVTARYVSRLLPLAFLAPEIVERLLDGRQPVDLTAEVLTRSAGVSSAWPQQRRQLRL